MSTPRSDQLHALACLVPRKKAGIHSMEGWVSSRGGLKLSEKEKIYRPGPGPSRSQRYTD